MGQTSAAVREAAAGEVCFYTPNAASPRVSGTTVMGAAAPVRAQQEASGVYAKVRMPLSFTAEPGEAQKMDKPAPKVATTPRPRKGGVTKGKYPLPRGAKLIVTQTLSALPL